MSFKKTTLYTPNPTTARGVGVKLSAAKDKVVYTSGRSVIVRLMLLLSTFDGVTDEQLVLDKGFQGAFSFSFFSVTV